MSTILRLEDTVPAGMLRHRLALGLSYIDALTGDAALGPLRSNLEAIGPYVITQCFESHSPSRHALRYAGRIQKLFDKAVAQAVDKHFYARLSAPLSGGSYTLQNDARLHVPRRLSYTLQLDGNQPAASPGNIRAPWLWPGSAYPFAATTTLIRGRALRGPTVATGMPIVWARVAATIPSAETTFAAATVVANGHGDDRGEFVLAVNANAAAAADLSNPLSLRLWVFVAPAGGAVNPADPLDGLPMEDAGSGITNDVLSGIAIPASYTQYSSTVVVVRLGQTKSDADTTVLFP